ncbi:MAG: hypothetical protein H0U77_13320 [Nocardioidaceae bacterium]|nr:hypothetical protein [Nocardioidaceae bacterium]
MTQSCMLARRVAVLVSAAVVAALGATAVAPPATGEPASPPSWEPVQTVMEREPFDFPLVTTSSTGLVVAVAYDSQGWYASTRPPGPGQKWSEPEPLQVAVYQRPVNVVTSWPDGRITFLFGDVLVTMAADGTFGPPEALPFPWLLPVRVSGAATGLQDGRLVAASHVRGGFRAGIRAPDGTWTASERYREPHAYVVGVWSEPRGPLRVAVLRTGYRRTDREPRLFSVELGDDATWGARENLDVGSFDRYRGGRFGVDFRSNADGDASLLWQERDARPDQPVAVVSTRPAGGTWSEPLALQSNVVANRIHFLRPDGTTLVATASDSSAPDAGKLVVARLPAGGDRLEREVVYEGLFQYFLVTVQGGMAASGEVHLAVPTRAGSSRLQRFWRCTERACVEQQPLGSEPDSWGRVLAGADGATYVVDTQAERCGDAPVCSRRLPPG